MNRMPTFKNLAHCMQFGLSSLRTQPALAKNWREFSSGEFRVCGVRARAFSRAGYRWGCTPALTSCARFASPVFPPRHLNLNLSGFRVFFGETTKGRETRQAGEAADVSARSKQTSATRPTRRNAHGRAAAEHREAAEVVLLKHRRSNPPKPGPKPRNLAKARGKREGCAHSAAERTAQRALFSGQPFCRSRFPSLRRSRFAAEAASSRASGRLGPRTLRV